VRVVPTEAALRFVGAPTWEALSGQPVATSVWSNVPEVEHVRLGQTADLILVVPATADLLARAAHGQADDLLTSTLLAARCPVMFAPAMHTEMWEHPATVENVATLRQAGARSWSSPRSAGLTGSIPARARLPEPQAIFELAQQVLAGYQARDMVAGASS
jgi:phosphopantothenoylcysteine decarboxylase/phosphopantothenate--cysteine ligase